MKKKRFELCGAFSLFYDFELKGEKVVIIAGDTLIVLVLFSKWREGRVEAEKRGIEEEIVQLQDEKKNEERERATGEKF